VPSAARSGSAKLGSAPGRRGPGRAAGRDPELAAIDRRRAPGIRISFDRPRCLSAPTTALLVVSFGAPRARTRSFPFSRMCCGAATFPPQRLEQVAAHYRRFGGVSPLNEQNRA